MGNILITTMGNRMKAIQRRSYRIPIKKEGITSPNEMLLGLKAMNVMSRYRVKISRKIGSRFATHSNVFGILYRLSISGSLKEAEECKLSY